MLHRSNLDHLFPSGLHLSSSARPNVHDRELAQYRELSHFRKPQKWPPLTKPILFSNSMKSEIGYLGNYMGKYILNPVLMLEFSSEA